MEKSWTRPPRSVYDFLARFLDKNYDNRSLEMPEDLKAWINDELDLDSSESRFLERLDSKK